MNYRRDRNSSFLLVTLAFVFLSMVSEITFADQQKLTRFDPSMRSPVQMHRFYSPTFAMAVEQEKKTPDRSVKIGWSNYLYNSLAYGLSTISIDHGYQSGAIFGTYKILDRYILGTEVTRDFSANKQYLSTGVGWKNAFFEAGLYRRELQQIDGGHLLVLGKGGVMIKVVAEKKQQASMKHFYSAIAKQFSLLQVELNVDFVKESKQQYETFGAAIGHEFKIGHFKFWHYVKDRRRSSLEFSIEL